MSSTGSGSGERIGIFMGTSVGSQRYQTAEFVVDLRFAHGRSDGQSSEGN